MNHTDESWETLRQIICVINRLKYDAELRLGPVIEEWKENKKDLYEMLGGTRYIVPMKGSVPQPETVIARTREMYKFIANLAGKSTKMLEVYALIETLEVDEIVSNTINSRKYIYNPEAKMVVGEKEVGIKVSKRIGQMLKGDPHRNVVLTEWSILLQDIRQQDDCRMVLSIDPVDLLLIGTAKHWGTCQNVLTGSYKAGAYAYLVDKHTMVAYVYNKDVDLPLRGHCFNVPHKLWRSLVYASPKDGMALVQRQYPSSMMQYKEKAGEIVGELLSQYRGVPLSDVKRSNYVSTNDYIRSMGFSYVDSSDMLVSVGAQYPLLNHYLKVGGTPPCPLCGTKMEPNDCNSSTTYCHKCLKNYHNYGSPCPGEAPHCSICNGIFAESRMHTINGVSVCDECLRTGRGISVCPGCGEVYVTSGGHICTCLVV